jgi:hypothetical protein
MTWSVHQMPCGFTLPQRKRNEKRPQQAGGVVWMLKPQIS